jgi:hypothetical protein
MQISSVCVSVERSPPIEEVISTGVVPRFIEFLVRGDYPQLQVWEQSHSYQVPFIFLSHWHVLYLPWDFFVATVRGCLGAYQHSIWHIREH